MLQRNNPFHINRVLFVSTEDPIAASELEHMSPDWVVYVTRLKRVPGGAIQSDQARLFLLQVGGCRG